MQVISQKGSLNGYPLFLCKNFHKTLFNKRLCIIISFVS
nr:MAG TPA: hypothetical protein [Caudoviricetes sp.]